jgi:D-alanyl-D-alanine endopeptidase (penicillin-binding protein 7)
MPLCLREGLGTNGTTIAIGHAYLYHAFLGTRPTSQGFPKPVLVAINARPVRSNTNSILVLAIFLFANPFHLATAEAAPTRAATSKKVASRPGQTASKGKAKTAGTKKTTKSAPKKPAKKKPTERHVIAMRGNQPNVQAKGALVLDLDTGQELYTQKPDLPRPIASISKLAAMLTVLDRNLDLDGLTTMKKVDSEVARGGAKSRLLEGMILSNRDLLHAAMLGSDNRAVSALGRAVGLGTAQFTTAMNRKVASLGFRYTRFREPTGLSPDNQSTPREVIGLLKAAIEHPILGPVVRRHEYSAHPVSKPPIKYVSTHRPAARANLHVLGGKTGYNDAARYCLVFAAQISGRNYGMAFLSTEGELTRFGDVARVTDWIITHRPKRVASTAIQGPPPPDAILRLPDAGAIDGPNQSPTN